MAPPTCIILDSKTGEVTYRFDYYMYGQFMRFILPGAQRIESSGPERETIAFQNPDGTIVLRR